MIDTYIWSTPNSYKITIMLEETALPYRVVPVNMIEGEQLEPKFLALNPNNKVPVIRDDDGPTVVFESGAILASPGSARGTNRARTWPTTRTSSAGTKRSRLVPR
jgi:GST-like protein